MDEDNPADDLSVEEISLDDLRDREGDGEEAKKEPGGLRAGGLGPEGSRYSPPEGKGKSTWKPMAAALILFIGGFYGIFTIGYQMTLESSAEGEFFDLHGQVLDYDEAYAQKEVFVEGVNVSMEGLAETDVTDKKGRFTIHDVPGGKFTLHLFKRSWDEAVNTTYISILYTGIDKDSPATFLAKVEDLAPDRSRPVYEGDMGVLAEVMDWPTNTTATLRIHATAYDQDLTQYYMQASADGATFLDLGPYANIANYNFVDADQSGLTVRIVDDGGATFAETIIGIEDHPLGEDGWESTEFPQVSLFVRGGLDTNGTDRTVLVSSKGSTEYAYRVDGGDWSGWTTVTDGSAEFNYTPEGDEGDKELEVMCRNATGVNGTTSTVTINYDATPPDLEPDWTNGPAVTNEATFDPGADELPFIRYRPVGIETAEWSAWQLYMAEVLVPIDDTGDTAIVTFQARDPAGNIQTADGEVEVKHQKEFVVDDYDRFYENLKICIPVQVLGVILAFIGGYSAFKRRRPNLVILGAIGALLAGYGIVGALVAAIALVFVMFSRDEFEAPVPPPPEE